jgi:hemoglobin
MHFVVKVASKIHQLARLVMLLAQTLLPPPVDEAGITTLVAAFYARVRADELLGPVFARAVPEALWAEHLGQMNAFWSSVVLASGRYHGKPVQVHAQHLDVLTPAMFTRWLALWTQTSHALFPPAQAEVFVHKATLIANTLQTALFGANARR